MLPPMPSGLMRRVEPYVRAGRIEPVMRAGAGKRSPLLFHRADVEKLRDELLDQFQKIIANTKV